MGSRTERMRAAQMVRDAVESQRGPAPLTRATEGNIRGRPRTPLASHLLGIVGLGLLLLNLPIVWIARSHGWNVTDGVFIVMVLLFVGGIGLVGLAAIVRSSAART